MEFNEILFVSLSTSTVVVGIAGFIGKVLIERHRTGLSKEIEKLKNNLGVISHAQKLSITRYDELKATSLKDLHGALVDFEFFLEEQLNNIHRKWNEAYRKSREEHELDDKTSTEAELGEGLLKQTRSKIAMGRGILEYIAYESFSKWSPEFKKLKKLVLKKEIYIENNIKEQTLELIKNTETSLNSSVKSIASVGLIALEDGRCIDEEINCEIEKTFRELHKECWERFRPVRERITQDIKIALSPKSSSRP